MTVHGLVDTTEMYLKAAYELEEDGIVALRARIAERLGHRAPTVSQTVARMQRDGLLAIGDDRHLELSAAGRRLAVRVMCKHRLAEVLLHRVIGLDWAQLHTEACRWEHVLSAKVGRRVFEICERPRYCPYGAPIPGLAELGVTGVPAPPPVPGLQAMPAAVRAGRTAARLYRISERIQDDVEFLRGLRAAGILPGAQVELAPAPGNRIRVRAGHAPLLLSPYQAAMLVICDPPAIDRRGAAGRSREIARSSVPR
ncbi:metal-dependent transcriptional regulator [Nocardia panacis]|uniref:Metal-dependent transcriptional regulator n=1 Tax=Nocardia panacis TaxID=2340916 RepID=A0A3A4KNW2_9NOCA|nr:metal-dependent transcriptional regulator [Nocardia panacis]RJO74810.1 metal-dependent transcriptional regulator [Nocardia panacis]